MQTYRLQDLCLREISDGTHQTPTYTEDKVNGYKFLSSKDVTTGKIDWQHIKYIPAELHNELYARLAPKRNDILLAKNGTTGVAAIVDCDDVFDIYVSLALIRPDPSKVIPKYLLYAINSMPSKEYFNRNLKGIGVPNLHLKQIRETPIRVPSFSEQQHIITVLDSIYELTKARKEQLSQLDMLINSRFIELFGDPETNPLRWDKVNISAVVNGKVANGFFAKRDDYCENGNVQVLGVANVVNRMYSNVENLPKTNGTASDIEKYGVKYGDMLFCRSSLVATGIGKASVVSRDTPNNVLFECHVIRLPLDLTKCVPEFMQVLSTTDYFRKQIISQSKTATMTTIGQDGIMKSTIILPPLELQKQFLSFVEHIDKLKAAVTEALTELQTLEKSLMQQYFG